MKKVTICTVFLLLIWSSRLIAAEAQYKFTTIAVPQAAHTWSWGINDLGDIVGMFSDDVGPVINPQAFLFSDGQYYELGIDGARVVVAYGINRDGLIAGAFSGSTGQFGFIMDESKTTILDQAIRAEGINNRGAVVGYRSLGNINQLAYKWKDGVYTQLLTAAQIPGLAASAATGINGKNIVGYYSIGGDKPLGFIRKSGVLEPIDILPLGVNRDGVIVGLAGAGLDGAVLENGIVTLIKVPGADYTQVHGINNKGVIVGYYMKAGVTYGFYGKPIVKVANGNKK